MNLNKEEMQTILSCLLMTQVVNPCYESVVFDLSQEWEQAPVIVKDALPNILNKLIVELVEGIKQDEGQNRTTDGRVRC